MSNKDSVVKPNDAIVKERDRHKSPHTFWFILQVVIFISLWVAFIIIA